MAEKWAASHEGPGGILSRAQFPEWVAAANWLRAMMEVSQPPGIRDAMLALRSAPPDVAFHAKVSGHFFIVQHAT